MEQMPEYKEGFITIWRNGSWVQVPKEDISKIMEEDNRGTQEGSELSFGS